MRTIAPRTPCAWLALLALAVSGLPAQAKPRRPAVRALLRTHAEIAGAQVRLGDVAVIRAVGNAMSATDRARLDSLVLGELAFPGGRRSFTAAEIGRQVQAHFPSVAVTPRQGRVDVRRQARWLGEEELLGIVTPALASALPWRPQDFRLEAVRLSPRAAPPLPQGALTVRAELARGAPNRGPTSFSVALDVEGREAARLWVTAIVRVRLPAVIVRRGVSRGQVLAENDVELGWRDAERVPVGAPARVEDVVGSRAKRPLAAHAIVGPDDVEQAPLIARGAPVAILVRAPGLLATARGVTMGEGRRGGFVDVMNTNSKKKLRGRVVDERTVEVEF